MIGFVVLIFYEVDFQASQFEQIETQLNRVPKKLPTLKFNTKNLFEYNIDDFILLEYDPHPTIKAKMNI